MPEDTDVTGSEKGGKEIRLKKIYLMGNEHKTFVLAERCCWMGSESKMHAVDGL